MDLVRRWQAAQRDPSKLWEFDLAVAQYNHGSGAVRAGRTAVAAAASAQNVLTLNWYQQSKSYYCGPGSAFMILKYHGITKSKLEPTKSLTQANLAGSTYLKTEETLSTEFALKSMPDGLNKWRFGSATPSGGGYIQSNAIEGGTLMSMVQTDIQAGWPMAADMHEKQDGAHYNNHPNRKIGHWTVLSGYWTYSPYGDLFRFTDPAAGIPGFEASAQKFWLGINDTMTFMNTGGNWGIVW